MHFVQFSVAVSSAVLCAALAAGPAQAASFEDSAHCLSWLGYHNAKAGSAKLPLTAVLGDIETEWNGFSPTLFALGEMAVSGVQTKGIFVLRSGSTEFIPTKTATAHLGSVTAWGPVDGTWAHSQYCIETRLPGEQKDRFLTAGRSLQSTESHEVFFGSREQFVEIEDCGTPRKIDYIKPITVPEDKAREVRAQIPTSANLMAENMLIAPADYSDEKENGRTVLDQINSCKNVVTSDSGRKALSALAAKLRALNTEQAAVAQLRALSAEPVK